VRHSARRHLPVLLLVGATAGLVGTIAPWIPHQAAGLRIGAFDLFEATKYLGEVRSGAVPILREAFLLPVVISAALLSLVPIVPRGPRRAARWLFPAVAVLIPLTAIPAYPQILTAYRDPELRGQFFLTLGAALLALLSPLLRRLPGRVLAGVICGLALAGIVLPAVQLLRVRPLFARLYNAPVGVGWGMVICVLGLGLALLAGAGWLVLPVADGQRVNG
jgi:predicted membrane channel-forming protein YqfA (hemolysin III family)